MEVSIYQIINKVNNKRYIGITIQNPIRRWKDHQYSKNNYLIQRALRKYGISKFKFSVLEKVKSWDEACKKEIQYILQFNTKVPNGMNMTNGGEGTLGLKMSISHIGIKHAEKA